MATKLQCEKVVFYLSSNSRDILHSKKGKDASDVLQKASCSKVVGWCLTALSAQKGYIMLYRRVDCVKTVVTG